MHRINCGCSVRVSFGHTDNSFSTLPSHFKDVLREKRASEGERDRRNSARSFLAAFRQFEMELPGQSGVRTGIKGVKFHGQ